MKVKTLVVASAIGLMLLGFSLYECHLLPSTFSLKEAVAAGDVSPSQPEGLRSKTSERLYPSKQDFGAIKSLNGERRPLPMCEEEALSRIEKGLSRAHNSGIGFVPLKISNLSEAENHLIDKEVFIGYPNSPTVWR